MCMLCEYEKKVVQFAQPFDFFDIVAIPINVLRIGKSDEL